MHEVGGILYNDEPDEVKYIGKAVVRIFTPAIRDEEEIAKNRAEINRICNRIIDNYIRRQSQK